MINRPYTFVFEKECRRASYNEEAMRQVLKLVRNFVASLYLGSGQPRAELQFEESGDPKEAYLEWVRQWKLNYAQLSALIRVMRSCRRTVYYDSALLMPLLREARNKTKNPNLRIDQLREMIWEQYRLYEERLKEAAQVMLNARFNAKLASVGSKVVNAADSNSAIEGSNPSQRTIPDLSNYTSERVFEGQKTLSKEETELRRRKIMERNQLITT